MDLNFTPKSAVADGTALATISAAIEENNTLQKEQTLQTTLVGSRLLERLSKAANTTGNVDTVDINEINKSITIALLEAAFYKTNLEQNLKLVADLKLRIQMANTRDWYRDFVAKHLPHKGENSNEK